MPRELKRMTAALWAIAAGVNSGIPAAACWVVVTVISVDLLAEAAFDFRMRVLNAKRHNDQAHP